MSLGVLRMWSTWAAGEEMGTGSKRGTKGLRKCSIKCSSPRVWKGKVTDGKERLGFKKDWEDLISLFRGLGIARTASGGTGLLKIMGK